MIKETCPCGATLEYSPSGNYPMKEGEVAAAWRKDHHHEPRTVAPDVPKVSSEDEVIKVHTYGKRSSEFESPA